MNGTNRFHLNGNTIPSTIHRSPPPTKFIVTAFLLTKKLIFRYHIILSENFQSWYNGKPENQLVLTFISM